jgi:hypothetical protein
MSIGCTQRCFSVRLTSSGKMQSRLLLTAVVATIVTAEVAHKFRDPLLHVYALVVYTFDYHFTLVTNACPIVAVG